MINEGNEIKDTNNSDEVSKDTNNSDEVSSEYKPKGTGQTTLF